MSTHNLANKDNREYWISSHNQCPHRVSMWALYNRHSKEPVLKFNTFLDRIFRLDLASPFYTGVIEVRTTKKEAKEITVLLNGDRRFCKELIISDEEEM